MLDLAAGHGLLAHVMLLLDDTSPTALAVDVKKPASHDTLAAAMVAAWPRLAGRVQFIKGKLESVEVVAGDVVVSAHACGTLTDQILDKAIAARAGVALLPCCQVRDKSHPLAAWLAPDTCTDVGRVQRLQAAGHAVRARHIPAAITPRNRLLMGVPS